MRGRGQKPVMLLACLLFSTTICGQTPASDAGERDIAATSFAQLVFDFCAPAVSQSSGPIPSLGTVTPGLAIRGPFPLSQVGAWSKGLQPRLNAQADSMIYAAITRAVEVGRFHEAYAMADGSACIVVAQGIPYVASQVLTRIRSNPEYKLELDGEPQVYSHAKTGTERSFMVVVPREARKSAIEEVLIRISAGAAPRVADADREAWSKAIFQACLQSVRQRSLTSASSFGEFMIERAEKGRTSIVAPARYPQSMLFPEEKPFGCRIMLSAGVEDNAKVIASWRTELQNVSAKPSSSTQDESYLIAPANAGEDRTRVTITKVLSGLYSLTILSDGK